MGDDDAGPIARGAEWIFNRAHADAVARMEGIPGPRPMFPMGNLDDFLGAKPWEVLHGYAKDWGEGGLVRWWWGGEHVLTATTPEVAHAVLVAQEGDFYKNSPAPALAPLLTDVEPFLANPPAWEEVRARSLFALPGMRAWLDAQVPRFAARARARLGALAGAEPEDALNLLRRMGFDAFTEMAVGRPFDDGAYDDMLVMARAGDERMGAMGAVDDDITDSAFVRARDALWGRFLREIRAARGGALGPREDLLAHALRHNTPLSDEALAAALANLYFSGLFSTTSALLTTLWSLTNHPEARAAVRAELGGVAWTAEGLAALHALDAVIREATRLYPPVPVYLRNAAKDRAVTLAGHTVPPDTRVFVSNYAIHRSARCWDEPDAFRPSRWTEAKRAEVPYGHPTFWPFGMGRRACAGQEIALAYIRAVAAVAVADGGVRVGEGQPFEPENFFACMSAEGMAMSVSR